MARQTFREALDAWERPLVLYEVIPPHTSAPREEVADSAFFVRNLLTDHPVDAINIPEVRNESRSGARQSTYLSKMDPRQYGKVLQDAFGDLELIVNHPTVYAPPEELVSWFKATVETFDIRNVVLIGGESSKEQYPGPHPADAGQIARKEHGRDVTLGGITIPTRRREVHDEPQRLIEKARAGADFFTSQVVYESDSTKALLRDYAAACKAEGETPKPIFLSFAPATGRKDVQFLEWLGVDFPPAAREWILAGNGNALDRSVRASEHVLRSVLDYVDRRDLHVPIGINVEHVMRYNFDASEVLLDRLESLLEWKQLERRVA